MKLPLNRLPASRMTNSPRRRFLAGAAAVAAVVAVVSAVFIARSGPADKHLTAWFTQTSGLYTGDRVQVLGVPVGQVTSVTPQAGRVKVEMTYDPSVQIPAGAEAAIVTPTLVTTRSIQLTPAYHGSGAVLADGAVIDESRTAVPVEWDQIEKELNTLSTTLGPKGPGGQGANGALNKALTTAAANLKGNGQTMHDTLDSLSAAASTLSDNRGDLFGTLDNVQKFVAVLQQANGQVSDFEQQLASVSGVLSDNRQGLARTLASLHASLGTVTSFVASNRTALSGNLTTMNSVAANLNRSDQTIANILQFAPTQLANFNNIYNPIDHAITGALATNTLIQDPAEFVCATIFDLGGTDAACRKALSPLLNLVASSEIPVSADPVNRGGFGRQVVSVGSGSKSGTASNSTSSSDGGLINTLLGGGGGS